MSIPAGAEGDGAIGPDTCRTAPCTLVAVNEPAGPSTARRESAGILLYRRSAASLEVLLAHPGGPYFARRDEGAWSIPKGEIEPGETALSTARREFREETGLEAPEPLAPLGTVRQRGGKQVHAWAAEAAGEIVVEAGRSTFSIEWPPRSGRTREFPENDRLELMDLEAARRRINPAQIAFLDRLVELLGRRPPPSPDRA